MNDTTLYITGGGNHGPWGSYTVYTEVWIYPNGERKVMRRLRVYDGGRCLKALIVGTI